MVGNAKNMGVKTAKKLIRDNLIKEFC